MQVRLLSAKLAIMVTICASLLSFATYQPAQAASSVTLNIADFEGGVDSRGSLAAWGSARSGGPWYAWENPATPASDDINYWDTISNGGGSGFIDYNLNIQAQNWVNFTTLESISI